MIYKPLFLALVLVLLGCETQKGKAEQATALPSVTGELTLPSSNSTHPWTPDATLITVTRDGIWVGEEAVVQVTDGSVSLADKGGQRFGLIIGPLLESLKAKQGTSVVIADHNTPYRLLVEVVHTAREAKLNPIEILTARGERFSSARALKSISNPAEDLAALTLAQPLVASGFDPCGYMATPKPVPDTVPAWGPEPSTSALEKEPEMDVKAILKAELVPDTPQITGALSPKVIQDTTLQHSDQVKACFEAELYQDPSLALEGTVEIKFIISPEGDVLTASMDTQPGALTRVGRCLTREVKTWQYPARTGLVKVKYPFVFKSNVDALGEDTQKKLKTQIEASLGIQDPYEGVRKLAHQASTEVLKSARATADALEEMRIPTPPGKLMVAVNPEGFIVLTGERQLAPRGGCTQAHLTLCGRDWKTLYNLLLEVKGHYNDPSCKRLTYLATGDSTLEQLVHTADLVRAVTETGGELFPEIELGMPLLR